MNVALRKWATVVLKISFCCFILLITIAAILNNSMFNYFGRNIFMFRENEAMLYTNIASLRLSRKLLPGQIIKTKGYYISDDGGAGLYNVREKKNSDIDNDGSIIFLANGKVAELISDGEVNVKQFGAIGDGIADDTNAVVNALACGKTVFIPKGHYLVNKAITVTKDLTLYGEGEASVLDWQDSIQSGDALTITGKFIKISGIIDARVNDNNITFISEHGLKAGDVFCIANPKEFSWSPRRSYYRAGEMCEVDAVTGTSVRLVNRLFDSYKGRDVNIYKMISSKVNLHDLKLQGTTSFQLLRIYGCKKTLVKNVTIHSKEGGYTALIFQKCFDVKGENLDIYLKGTDNNDYGMTINNCQRVQINGGSFYGRRHGIAIGGTGGKDGWSVINRDIHIMNAKISSIDQYSADMHGCTEFTTYEKCKILNGAIIGGANNSYSNCEVISRNNGVCIYGSEILGGLLKIECCSLKSVSNPKLVKRGFIDFGGNNNAITEKVMRDLEIIVKNCNLDLNNIDASGSSVVRLVNRGARKKINIDINGLTLLNTERRLVVLSVVKTNNNISDNSDYIIINNINGLSKESELLKCENGYLKSALILLQSYD